MAERRYPTEQFSASNFAACGGSILIQSTLAPLEICLLHRTARDGRDEWVLPKGHKDRGEDVAEAAARETYEETGYPCRLLPLDMTTVATVAGQQTPAVPSLVRRCEKEPFMLTLRRPDDAPVKVIWWFVTVRTGADKVDGTQTANERFESAFYGVDEALKRTTFGTDRELIEAAVELVRATYPETREEQKQSQPSIGRGRSGQRGRNWKFRGVPRSIVLTLVQCFRRSYNRAKSSVNVYNSS